MFKAGMRRTDDQPSDDRNCEIDGRWPFAESEMRMIVIETPKYLCYK